MLKLKKKTSDVGKCSTVVRFFSSGELVQLQIIAPFEARLAPKEVHSFNCILLNYKTDLPNQTV